MKAPPRLALVPATASTSASNVVHISGPRSQGPAPRRTEWRDLMRRIVRNQDKGAPGDAAKPEA